MDERQWKKANPALGLFRSIDDMRKQAEKAARMPSFENTFRNLNLNQRVSCHSPFISKMIWDACAGETCPLEECTEIYGGLDLSGRTDLTARVFIGHKNGLWNVYPRFWTPEIGLLDRAKRDRAPYDVWVDQGFITTVPGASVDYEFVAKDLAEDCPDQLVSIAYDRWRIDLLRKELEEIGAGLPLVEFGQGFKDMSPAIDTLEARLLNGVIRHGADPVLTMCAANSIITKDAAGNRKLDKQKTTGRIDGMVGLTMATGISEKPDDKEPEPEHKIFFVG